ncbi:MAG: outer membrane lipoprotein carrier protein LolA [Pseudomonadota bacterium]
MRPAIPFMLRAGLLLAILAPLPVLALEIDTLATALADRGAGSTTYRQVRYLGVLDEPLESSGRLSFRPPDRLVQEQLAPERRTLTLDGDRLSLEEDGRRREFDLDDSPQAAALATSLRGILNGQVDVLREDYELVLGERAGAGWQLNLLPRDQALAERIRRIEVTGTLEDGLARVDRLILEFANGDRNVMHMEPPSGANAP